MEAFLSHTFNLLIMTGIHKAASSGYLFGALAALLIMAYLVYSLIKTEKF